jgi:O-antigen/teichoic acid export membrane protein
MRRRRGDDLVPLEFHQVLASGGLRLISLPVSAVFTLATIRLLIDRVGAPAFGVVSLITSLSAFLPFADLGVGAAVINAVARSENPHDDPHLAAVLLTSLRILCWSALAVIAIGIGGASLGIWTSLLGVGTSGFEWAVGSAIALFGLALPLGIGQRVLIGARRSATMVALQAAAPPLTLSLVWLLGDSRLAGPFYALCAPAVAVAVGIATVTVAAKTTGIRLWPQLLNVPHVRARRGVSVWRTAAPMVVITLGIPLALQTDRVILAHRAGLTALAHYAVAIQLYAPLWTVVATAGVALWPVFARGGEGGQRRSVSGPMVWFMIAGALGGLALFVGGPWIAQLVTGTTLHVDRGLYAALGILLMAQAAQLPVGMYFMTDAGLRFQAVCVTWMLPVSLSFSWWAAGVWGAKGPVVGSIVAIVACQWLPGLRRARGMGNRARASSSAGSDSKPILLAGAQNPEALHLETQCQ